MTLTEIASRSFTNGTVYLLHTEDGYPVEVTDTFLPWETKGAINNKTNKLTDLNVGSRAERWMIGVSTMSGCPVGCKFCATGKLKKWRKLTYMEIVEQVFFILGKNINYNPADSQEFKINYTRMGEPFLNIDDVRAAINMVDMATDLSIMCGGKPTSVHHYVSTIGIKGSDFSWIKDNITLQISLHSLDETKRDWLIPVTHKMSLEELGAIRTRSNLKTTVNMTLVDESDFDIEKLKKYFDPRYFFIKLSPINKNCISEANNLGNGVIEAQNLL